MKRLRTEFGYNINHEQLWMKKFAKFKTKLAKWQARDLTLKGKILLHNSYIVSSLNYMSEINRDHVID